MVVSLLFCNLGSLLTYLEEAKGIRSVKADIYGPSSNGTVETVAPNALPYKCCSLQMRTMAGAVPEASVACSTSSRCLPLRRILQQTRVHQAALRQRAAGSLSPACLRTLASRSTSSRRALHVTAAAATETKEETFTYQAEVGMPHPPEHIDSMGA